jgi:DeoR family transcriptional regulator of aga operon
MNATGRRPNAGDERRLRVLTWLREVGVLSVTDLARELGVSHMTVRRDLHLLEAEGHVRTVHGGVGLSATAAHGPMGDAAAGWQRIARYAARLVGDQDSIALDAGVGTYELAKVLLSTFEGSVITHSIPVMQLLAEQPSAGLVALGGELLPDRRVLVGPATLEAIARLRVRTFFMVAAVDDRGTYACSVAEASVQRALMKIADEVVLLAAHEAFRRSAPALVAPLDTLNAAVTDIPPPSRIAAALARAGVTLHVAPT